MGVKHLWRSETGSTAVEFAFIGLVVIVLSIATLEIGRALHLSNELSFAADHGTRLVLLNPDATDTEVEAEVRSHLRLANTEGLEIITSHNSLDAQPTRGLHISLPVELLIPASRLPGFRLTVERRIPTS